jgi:adenosylcobinamide-GDP ribazoletransferase
MNALMIALQFLTRFPISQVDYNDHDMKQSIYWYGVAGIVIGGALYLATLLLMLIAPSLNAMVAAVVVLLIWVLLTGALHLDGLADSADAWLGSHDKNRMLEIMKDPRCGPAGVTSIVLILLLKFACLQAIILQHPAALILIPALSRSAIPLLFLYTPYVREAGLGQAFKSGLSKKHCYFPIIIIMLLGIILVGTSALYAGLLLALTYYGLRRLMLHRLGGITGDTAGACIEILEATALLAFAICLN